METGLLLKGQSSQVCERPGGLQLNLEGETEEANAEEREYY